jgi:peptide/nickel transport system substrate-binding protein
MSFIFDTLTWKDSDGEVIPALAQRWRYLTDENAYVFELNRNATWHDGKPLTAHDVVFTVDYIKTHPTAWIDPKILRNAIAIDSDTVKLTLSRRHAPFLTDIAGTMPILPCHIWADVIDPRSFGGDKALTGTGPFKLMDYDRSQGSYLYEANPEYYGGSPSVDRLRFITIGTEMVAAALQQGQVDAGPIPPDLADKMSQAGFEVIQAPYGWHLKLVMNHEAPPLDQKPFRQALARAIDRNALVEITQRGHARPGNPGFVPPDNPWHNPEVPSYDRDLETARQRLQEAGCQIQGSKILWNGRPLRLQLLSQPQFKDVGLFVKKELERLGIQIDLQGLEPKTLDSKILHWQFQLALSGHGALYEPSFLKRAVLDEGFNSARYHENAELTRLILGQMKEMDPVKRREMVFRAQRLYAEDLPDLTLYYPNWYWAHNGKVGIFYTRTGIAIGIPIPLNKQAFVEKGR